MRGDHPIAVGMAVLTSDGKTLGHVKAISADGGYFHVDCPLAPDYYVPMDAVALTESGSVHLRLSKLQSGNMGWEAKPA